MKKNKKSILIIFSIILLIVCLLSIGFAAFQKQLLIDDSIFNVRLQKDTRVSANIVQKVSGDAVSNYEDYNVSKIYGNVTFPTASSYVLYKVDLTNYGNVKTGLLNITSNTSGVNYSICNSSGSNCSNDPKTAVCSGSNCTLGSTKTIYVKVTSTTAGTKNIDLDLDFEPYHTISYYNFNENISSFETEIMENDTYEVTLTSDVEEVEISGTGTASYNKNTHKLTINNVSTNVTVSAKYSLNDIVPNIYSGNNPDNYVLLDEELYRIVLKEQVDDGYGNTELRTKLIKETSIGNNTFDGLSNEFGGSNISTILNETYYNSMSNKAKELIESALWTEDYAENIGLIKSSDYTSNSSWLTQEQYTLTKGEDNTIVAVTSTGLTDSLTTISRATYPVVYAKSGILVIDGNGQRTNPYVLELPGDGKVPNPIKVTGKTLTVTGSNQELITVSNQLGAPHFSVGTPINASNYDDYNGNIPTRSAVGNYTIYYYVPEMTIGNITYKAKSGNVKSKINGLTFLVNYSKGNNVNSIGKTGDSCTTSGSSLSCSVTLPSITPSTGYENGKWNYNSNTYNPNASFELNSSRNGITLTATASGKTYVATFNKNGATSVTSESLSCTVSSGSTCTVTAPTITRNGYTVLGWGESASSHTSVVTGGLIELSSSKTYYAITKKEVTITFNKNGNTAQIPNGGTQTTANTITESCTMWNQDDGCNVTSPEIVMNGYTKHGYSTGATTYSGYWNQKTAKEVSADATWFAQTSIAEKTVTITFNKNGNTSQTPKNGSASTANTITQSCTIEAARNGASQATTCSITSPTINMSGFTIIGYSDSANNHTSSWDQNTVKNVSSNETYFAQTSKAAINRTMTFNKNNNTSFTYDGNTYTDTSESFTLCTIAAVYNGASQSSSCSATINMPTFVSMNGFNPYGWSTGPNTVSISYTSGQSNVTFNMNENKTYYAISIKPAIDRKITFYRNGNTSFTYGGTTYTDTSKTFTVCTIAAVYNGNNQASSCTATITMPTITASSGFTNIGWSSAAGTHTADYTSGQTNVSITMNADKAYYAQSSKAGVNRTITFYKNGNTAFTYNSVRYTDTSKTFTVCSTPTVYNGESSTSSCNATVTMPTIEAASGFTNIGWSSAAGTHTADYTSGQSNVSMTMNADKAYYAQSSKAAIDRKITFHNNGNTSFKYNGTTYTDTSESFTVCTIDAVYNGSAQSSSCTATITMPTITAASGFTTIGWNSSQTTYTAEYTSGQTNVSFTMSSDKNFYAQSSKAGTARTITFYKNGNQSFTYSGTTYTDTSKSFTVCTTETVYNGATQSSSCTATITMPTIEAASGFTNIGWSSAAGTHTADYTSGQTNVSITMNNNKSYYAQSSKAAINRTITFYRNGNTSFTYSGTTYTDTSKTFTVCTIDAVYNGSTQSSSCNATITMPIITAASGFTNIGWSSAAGTHTADYTSGQANVSITMNNNKSYYAQSSKAAINRTITFYRNGNQSFTYSGTTYTDTSKTFTVCTIDAVYNGSTQSSSCNATITMPTITAASGFTNIGWSSAAGTHTADYTSGQSNVSITMDNNKSYYAQSSKAAIDRTITFYRNGNISFTYNGTTSSNTSKTFTVCTIDAVYNGSAQSSSCTATITMPTIEAPSGFTNIGWSSAAGTHTADYISGQANVSITMNNNKSYYAQSSKAAIDRTITFYRNGNTSFTYSGTTYTDTSESFTVCTIDEVYNGGTQSSSCTATITMPTITAASGYTQNGWGTSSTSTTPAYTSGQTNVSFTMSSNRSYYALKKITNPATPTISGAGTSVYGNTRTLTCSTSTTYPTSMTVYYSFGYSTTDGGTPSNWTTAGTSATYNAPSDYSTRYYSCRIYVNDGTASSSTVTSSAASDAQVIYVNARIDFDATTNGGTLDGSTPIYVQYNSSTGYTARTNSSTTRAIPSASKTGNTFNGWYTAEIGGTKVINANGSLVASVSGWTSSSGKFALTNTSDTANTNKLYAQFTGNTVTATFYYNSNTTSGSITAATTTAQCTVSGTTCTITVPNVVRNSVGKYNSAYKGVSTAINGMGSSSLEINEDTTYYANYSSTITIYYPNSSNTISNSTTALYRNEYFTNTSATEMSTVTSTANNSTTQATTVTLSSIKGTFAGLATAVNTTTNYAVDNTTNIINSNATTFYAVTSASENVSFKYNNNTTCGSATVSTATQAVTTKYYCQSTSAMGTSHGTTTTVPSTVSSSKGQYNSTYRAMAAVNSLTPVTTFTGGNTYYAIYSSEVTNYYYDSSYTSRTIYRNEYLASASATTYTSVIATANTGASNYTTAGGPNSSTWYGLADSDTATRKYSSVAAAAKSNTCTTNLYSIYQYTINYAKGSNVDSIGATSGSCRLDHGSTSCNVTLPTITPNTGYLSAGWNTTSGATTGTAEGSSYSVTTNATVPTLYANANIANYLEYNGSTLVAGYSTLQSALSGVTSGNTIKVMANTTENNRATLASGKTGVKIDLNGKTVTMNNCYIDNKGTLDIYNTSSTAGTLTGSGLQTISNSGILTINGTSNSNTAKIINTLSSAYGTLLNTGTITINNNSQIQGANSLKNSSSTININGGIITGVFSNASGAQMNISGSTTQINTSSSSINNGILTMSGGTLTSTSLAISNSGELTITDGTINSTSSYAVQNDGTIHLNNGSLISNTSYGIYNDGGTVAISGGSVSGTIGIYNFKDSELTITGSATQIIGTNGEGIYNTGTCNISNGTISGTYGISNRSMSVGGPIYTGEALVTGGTITGSSDGIYIVSGTVTLGTNDSTVSTTTPLVQTTGTANERGVYNTGTFNFYDGIIKSPSGTGYAISGTVSDIPDEYIIKKETTSGIESATLVLANYSNTSTNAVYDKLNDAFSAVSSNQTIKVLQDVTESSPATLASEKTGVKLDLNGKTISFPSIPQLPAIQNTGTLDIYSSASGGIIEGNKSIIIINSGTLTTNNTSSTNEITIRNIGTYSGSTVINNSTSSSVTLKTNTNISVPISSTNSRYLIVNNGTVTIAGAVLTNNSSSSANARGINITNAAATLTVSSGTINTTGYSIYNSSSTSTSAIRITGGTTGTIYNNTTGQITVTSGTTGTIYNYSTGTVYMSGGTVAGGIDNSSSGTVTVTSGSVGGVSFGIRNVSGTITLGVNDSTVSTSNPSIEALSPENSNGIVNEGTFYYYDGLIKKPIGGMYEGDLISGNAPITPSGYVVHIESISGAKQAYLVSSSKGGTDSVDNNVKSEETNTELDIIDKTLDMVSEVGNSINKYISDNTYSYLMSDEVNSISSTSKFLNTDILRGEIRSIKFDNSIGKHKAKDKNTWDVSKNKDGSILLWADKKSDGYYDISIGEDNDVVLPINSSYLFAYLNNLENISFNNANISRIENIYGMFYGCNSLNDESIESITNVFDGVFLDYLGISEEQ